MPNDNAIDISLIGGKLEYLDKLCRAKRTAGEEFKEACKAIGREFDSGKRAAFDASGLMQVWG